MEFHIREATGTSPVAVGLYANSSDYRWSESTVTWNYADFTLTKQYATASPGYGNETVYDITDLVHAWQAGEEDANMGITLKSSNETSVDKAFYATEYSTSSYRPYVTLTYDSEIELNKSVVNLAPNGTTTITAETAVAGGTITWSSSDTSIATATKTGTSTCKVTAVKSGVTTITATVNDGPTASCTVYVSITNGVYFIKYGSLCLSVDGGMIPGSTLTLQAKKSSGPAQFRQLWKITHIGQHYYSIRSLYRPDLALRAKDDGTIDMVSLNTSLSGSSIPSNRRWMISRTGSSYLFHFTGTASLAMQPMPGSPSGAQVIADVDANSQYTWTLEWGPTIENQVLLINTQNGLPATNAVRKVASGETLTLSDLNLTASFICQYDNYQDIKWHSTYPSFATVDESTGAVTGVAAGETTITASGTYNGLTYSKSFKVIVSKQMAQFIDKMGDLYDVAYSYEGEKKTEALETLFNFIRGRKEIYKNSLWNGIAGDWDTEFVDYVETNHPSLYRYFINDSENNELMVFDTCSDGNIDVPHLAATLNRLFYTGETSYHGWPTFGIYDERIDALSGWAGDCQTLIQDYYDEGNTNGTLEAVYNIFYPMIGSTAYTFSYDDIISDVDACNLYTLLSSQSITTGEQFETVLVSYYYSSAGNVAAKRFTTWVGSYTEDTLQDKFFDYCNDYSTIIAVKWPFLKNYSIYDDQQKAFSQAFADYFWAQKVKE